MIAAVVLSACSSSKPGTAGHACYGNGTCNEGLECRKGTCVVSGGDEKPEVVEPSQSGEEAAEDDTEGVEGFIQDWALTQNKSDFDAYSDTYSKDFEGVRRSRGSKDRSFDRAGWLKDRRRMFLKGQRVDVESLKIEPGDKEGVFEVTFEQKWQSRTYADRGQKRLEVRREGSEWKIVREEMLSSKRWKGDGFFKGSVDRTPTDSRNVAVVYSFYDQALGDQARRRAQADSEMLRENGFERATVLAEQEWDNFKRCCHLVVITGAYESGQRAAEDVDALAEKGLRKGYVKRLGSFVDQGVDCGH